MAREHDLLRAARHADLQPSGLDSPATIKRLGLTKLLGKQETAELTGLKDEAVAYEIPYFDLDGKPTGYRRWKIIPIKLTTELPFKYYQEPKTVPHIYLPPLVDWRSIATDTSKRIILTEGEKKAACACLHGLPTIGLGGVWNWRARKWAMETLRDFEAITWQNREVEICFDGDLYSNENVGRALGTLCAAMANWGARVFIRRLDATSGASDLDTFLVKYGVDAYLELECEEDDNSKELHKLNEDLIYVKDMVAYYSTKERVFYSTVQKLMQRYGDKKIQLADGKTTSAVKAWTEWPHRRMVDSVTYAPGEPQFLRGNDDTTAVFNDWRGWGTVPTRGSVKHVLELLKEIGDEFTQDWLLKWMAYPLQHPGEKMYTAVMLWSNEQGTGKSFLGHLLCDIYGKNATVISDVDLHDERYAWMKSRQFVLAEEVTQAGRRQDLSLIKHLITGETIRVNEKYVPAYSLPNKVNLMFTSNAPDAVRLERSDRRFMVAEVRSKKPPSFWHEMHEWRASGGAAAWHWYLLNKVDTTKFNPRAEAPMSRDKEEMVYASMSGLEQWAYDLINDPDSMLGDVARAAPGKDVFTVADLMVLVPDELRNSSKGGLTSLGKALIKAGAVRGGPVATTSGTKRLIAIRNLDFWRAHSKSFNPRTWAANYEGKMVVAGSRRSKSSGGKRKR